MRFQHKIGLTAGAVFAALSFGVSANADEAGDKLLKQVIAKYKSLKTLSAATVEHDLGDFAITLELRKPNLYRVKVVPIKKRFVDYIAGVKVEGNARAALMVSNGRWLWTYLPEDNSYNFTKSPDEGDRYSPITQLFYAPDEFADKSQWTGALVKKGSLSTMESRITGTETASDAPCRVLEMTFSYYEKPNIVTKIHKNYFYVDKDNFVRRIAETTTNTPDDPNVLMSVETVKSMQTDIKLPDADFKFKPPAGAKREK